MADEPAPPSTSAIVRVVLLFLLLPAAFAFERMAYYGMRAMLFLHMSSDLGMHTAEAGRVYSITALAGLFTVFLGGGLCVVLRPGIVLVAGAALGIVAYGILTAAGSVGGVWAAMLLLSLAQGLFKPAVLAHAARELPHPRFHLRVALFVALYASINSAALVGTSGSSLAASRGACVSFVLSIVLVEHRPRGRAGAGRRGSLRQTEHPTRVPAPRRPRGAGRSAADRRDGALSHCHGPGRRPRDDRSAQRLAQQRTVWCSRSNPFVVMGTCGLVFAAFVALHFTRVRDLTLYAVGTGVAILAVAAAPLMIAAMSCGPAGDRPGWWGSAWRAWPWAKPSPGRWP